MLRNCRSHFEDGPLQLVLAQAVDSTRRIPKQAYGTRLLVLSGTVQWRWSGGQAVRQYALLHLRY